MDIDLNADLGEGYGPWKMGEDEALMDVISSANVACGFHAGDPTIMDRTIRLARERGTDIGAHVGFPDRQGFGRRVMNIEIGELASRMVRSMMVGSPAWKPQATLAEEITSISASSSPMRQGP